MPDLKKMLTLEALSEALPSWLKRSTKPEYNADEIDSTLTTNQFVTASDKDNWNAKGTYSKPSGGIPKSDLSSIVQTSLEKADSALQSETDPTVPSWAKQTNKPSYTQDEVADGTTYKRVTQTEKNAWNGKQNALTTTQMQAVNSGITSEGVAQISTNQANIVLVKDATKELVDEGAKNLFNPEKEILYGYVTDGNGYAFKSVIHDTRNVLTFVLLAYNNDTCVRKLNSADIISTGLFSFTFVKGSDFNSLRFGHSGEVQDIKVYADVSDLVNGETYVLSFNATAINPSVLIAWNSTMICTKAKWDVSHNFEPYTLPNYDLTVREAEDRAVLVEAIDNGVKNLLPKLKSYTDSGLSMVINDDNSITAKWSATGGSTLYARINDNNWTLPRGTYVLSGMPNDNNIGCYIHIETNTSQLVVEQERKTPVKFTIDGDYEYLKIYISVRPNSAAETSGVTILPMIVTKAVSDIGANIYVPPALPNTTLTPALIACVDDGAKNLWDFANANITAGGGADRITYVKTADSLTLTAVSTWAFVSYDIALKKGTYYFYGLISGLTGTDSKCVQIRVNGYQGTIIKRIDITANGAISDSFVVDTDRTITISLYASEGEYTSSAFTISNLMICTEAAWNLSHNYESFALSNPVITPALIEQVDEGAKNVLRYTFEGSKSANGITVTRNADGTITANGTAGSGNSYVLLSQDLTLPAGTYIISAVNASDSNCYIYDNASWESVSGNQERTLDGSTSIPILLRVTEGTMLSNVVIKPMICRKEAWNISTAFVPYRSDYNSISKFIEGVDISGTDVVYNADLNSIDRTITRIYSDPSNAPYGLYGFMLVKTLYTDANTVFQEVTAVNNQTGTMFDSVRPKFIRTKTSGSWDPWIEISENNRFLIDDGSYETATKTFNTTYLKYLRMYLITISRFYSPTSGSGVAMYAFNNSPSVPVLTTITEQSDCKATISVSNDVLTINYSEAGYYITSISLL